ncbi:MAG: Dyp-type peroxidase [Rhodospirillaceae bacterium]
MPITDRVQPGILQSLPTVARSLTFRVDKPDRVEAALRRFAEEFSTDWGIVALGEPCALALGVRIPGLRTFPPMSGPGCAVPSTQESVWVRLCGRDRGVVFDYARAVRQLLGDAFTLSGTLDTFTYHGGRDLTRFEDGTENPKDDKAVEAAIVSEGPLAGSSYLAVQQWVHDLDRFEGFSEEARDNIIGRSAKTNDELEDAPPSAHVKRSAQESFEPPAFMLRRSMPWAGVETEGLEFVAFVNSLDKFTRMMRRMTGLEDGVVDGLFSFSRPVTGGYYWCPPAARRRLDLRFVLANKGA